MDHRTDVIHEWTTIAARLRSLRARCDQHQVGDASSPEGHINRLDGRLPVSSTVTRILARCPHPPKGQHCRSRWRMIASRTRSIRFKLTSKLALASARLHNLLLQTLLPHSKVELNSLDEKETASTRLTCQRNSWRLRTPPRRG